MSAAPKPEPEQAPEPGQGDADGWALLEGLRRRLDDQAAQGRKTQQQVTQLAESIGALVEVQRRRSRWLNLNSFVAYLIFTILVGTGFYVLYRSRAHELVSARDSASRERDVAIRRADGATARLAAREQADARAWEIYELLEAGNRAEATAKLDTLGALPLSRTERSVLAARAHETQVMEVDAALKGAAVAFKAGRHAEVIAPIEAALVGEPAGARAFALRYFLGVAYAKTNQLDKAIGQLTTALAGEAEHEDVRFQLASALDRSGAYAKARAEYNRFATAHPQSGFAAFALRRSATLARMPAQAAPPANVTQPSVAAPAPVKPNVAAPNAGAPAVKPNGAAPNAGAPKPTAVPKPPATGSNAAPNAGSGAAVLQPKAPVVAPSPPSPLPPTPAPLSTTPLGDRPSPARLSTTEDPALPALPKVDPPSSMPAPTPWPAQPPPPDREPAPEVTAPTPPPQPAPPPAERFATPA